MYGGAREEPDHKAAAKAAKNEMQGLEAMANTFVTGLSYPMMTMIDYKVRYFVEFFWNFLGNFSRIFCIYNHA